MRSGQSRPGVLQRQSLQPGSPMRLFPSFVTLATALDAEEAAWVARWRRPPQSKKHHWHRLAGPIDVSCTFRYRLGLTKDAVGAAGPALDLRFDQHQRWLSEPHAPELSLIHI